MIHPTAKIGQNVTIKEGTVIGGNVTIEDNVYIDYGCIIRDNVHVKKDSFIGARSVLGEYLIDFYRDKNNNKCKYSLVIGEQSLIRTENIIYGNTVIGDEFQTGHKVTIRENTNIGNNVKIGTLSIIQHECNIGHYVNIHSNVFMGEKSEINDYVWIFPHVVLTNDLTPPSNELMGVYIDSFALIGAKSVILPGITIGKDALVGAGSVVTKDVSEEAVVVGNPAKKIRSIREMKHHLTGKPIYPWRDHFKRGMPWADSDYETWFSNLGLKEGE
ncbi:DapH/DapD/GlmU-related protein [Metabacillus fastidiosus]|uniref:acyltransferase n=1 Tax=Metabacillus fastidiosus TaxID=1458 RepID=UPI003D2927E5